MAVVFTGGIDFDMVVVAALIVVVVFVSDVAVRGNPLHYSNMALFERRAGAKHKQFASYTGSV